MAFTFSQMSGNSGITTIVVSANSRDELTNIVENYTLSNASGNSMLMPIAQKAYSPIGKYINFSPNSINWDSSGGTGSLNIQSNDEWTLVSNGWINLTRYEEQNRELFNTLSGNGNTIIGLRCSDNTGSTRTGGISGYCKSDSAISATTTIQQSGSYVKPYLTLGQYQFNVESSGQSGCSLEVVSNVDWEAFSEEKWITINTASGSSDGSVYFSVQENSQNIGRMATIMVSSTTESLFAECTVNQSASAVSEPYIIITPTTQNIPLSGGSFTISVSSNTDWNVTAITETQMTRPWISVDKLNGYGDEDVVVTIGAVGASEEISSRSGYISFYNNTQGLKTECDITQKEPNTTKLYYTSTSGNVVNPRISSGWGASIVSNTYTNGQGIIEFDGSVSAVPSNAFSATSLETVELPESVETIGRYAFKNCTSLTDITLYKSVTSFGIQSFENCYHLQKIYYGGTVSEWVSITYGLMSTIYNSGQFGYYDFYSNGILVTVVDLSLFNGTISTQCFTNCKSITTLILGTNVSKIKSGAFRSCYNLNMIYSYSTTAPTLEKGGSQVNSNVFINISSSGTLHYPQGSNYSEFIADLPNNWNSIADL